MKSRLASKLGAVALCGAALFGLCLASSANSASAEVPPWAVSTPKFSDRFWLSGGFIGNVNFGGYLHGCSTAGLGSYKGKWAVLTSAHCVKDVGTPVYSPLEAGIVGGRASGAYGQIGVVAWRDAAADLAIFLPYRQDFTTADFGRFVDTAGGAIPGDVQGGTSNPAGAGAALYRFGMSTGAATGTLTGYREAFTSDDGARHNAGFYEMSSVAGPGDSGAGVYIESGATYQIVGVVSGPDVDSSLVAPIDSVLGAGYRPFQAP